MMLTSGIEEQSAWPCSFAALPPGLVRQSLEPGPQESAGHQHATSVLTHEPGHAYAGRPSRRQKARAQAKAQSAQHG